MAAYDPNLPNGYDKSLIPLHIRKQYGREVIMENTLQMFMGTKLTDIIQVVNKENGTGPIETFSVFRELEDTGEVLDYDQISGKGQKLKFYTDQIRVRQRMKAVQLDGEQLTRLNTPIPVYEEMKPALQRDHRRRLSRAILKAATFDNYPDLTANGPVDDRVVYENSAWSASINTAVAAMTNATYDESGANVDAIMALRDIAIAGGKGAYGAEGRLSPTEVTMKNRVYNPYYAYLISTKAYRILQTDPKWNAQQNRGVIESSLQPSIINGGFLRGMIDNVYIYEVPELALFNVTSGGKTASWNLFCGAQAWGVVFRGAPWFTIEKSNHGNVVEMAVQEIRGHKALKFPSHKDQSVLIENGMIHHFTQIA